MNEPIKILLIEDNPGDIRLIRESLLGAAQARFEIQVATSLQAGLLCIRTDSFGAILLDLSLPDSFGMETLRVIHDETPLTAIIVLTGFADQQLGLRALQYGAQDYLVKDDTDGRILVRAIQYSIQRKQIEAAEQEQRHFAEALRQTAALLTSTLELNEVLDRMLTNLEHVIEHDAANIVLIEGDAPYIVRRRDKSKQRDAQQIQAESRLQLVGSPLLEYMQQTQQPVIIKDLQEAGRDWREVAAQANVRAYAGVPIHLRDETIGFINIFCFDPDAYDGYDTDRLAAFAEHAAIAIQNAKLYSHSRELASLQERQRLARELHDSVSQTLFTCQTMTESALRQFDVNPVKARSLLTQANALTTNALAEMRVLLLELRPAAMVRVSLRQLFEQYLAPMQSRLQLQIQLDIDPDLILSPDVQIALYRITQEALNNILKHSQATEVKLHIEDTETALTLEITDDGVGFDRSVVVATSLGLGIMQERADGIGAKLEIDTWPGGGTHISVLWPKPERALP
jgi:signal transduction histidine kinase